ncbi:unnamed protein product [Linum tenue]|uniref:Expansin n=1 Tax=Linum tenue TaxID=586396 RepID=A0AAV0PDN7_9ROSI|nr:unnamed protein product [Linum tenue]
MTTTTTSFRKYVSIPAAWILLVLAISSLPDDCRAYKKDSIFHAVSRHGKAKASKPVLPGPWKKAHATFYDGSPSSFGGACDFKDVVQEGYGMNTAALSGALFKGGEACGACFELKCVDNPQFCRLGHPTLHVTATDHCPPNPSLPNDNGGWCNPPLEHFDIAHPAFGQLAEEKSGIIPVEYRRVPCQKRGGIRFTILGNPWFIQARPMEESPRHFLRGQHPNLRRSVRLHRRGRGRIRDEHGGAQQRSLQGRQSLRRVLPDPVRRRPAVVQTGSTASARYGHGSLPAQPVPTQRQRRVVQSAPRALRHRHARFQPPRRV